MIKAKITESDLTELESLCQLTVGNWDLDTLIEYAAECMAQRLAAAIHRAPNPGATVLVCVQDHDGIRFYEGPYNCERDAALVAQDLKDHYHHDEQFVLVGIELATSR